MTFDGTFYTVGFENKVILNFLHSQHLIAISLSIKMFTKDLPGENLRRKMKVRVQLKIRRFNVFNLKN